MWGKSILHAPLKTITEEFLGNSFIQKLIYCEGVCAGFKENTNNSVHMRIRY